MKTPSGRSRRVEGADNPAESARTSATPPLAAIPLAALGGIASWLAFPPHDHWYLLILGLACLLVAVRSERRSVSAVSALVWGVALFLPLTAWANIYAGAGPWAALAVVEGVYIVVFGLLARTVIVRRGPSTRTSIVVACLWSGVEALRSHAPWGGLPWGASAFALQHSPLLHLGPWIGTAGLAVVVALCAQTLADAALALAGRRGGVGSARGLGGIALVAAAVLACLVVPPPHNPTPGHAATMRIAGIQGGERPADQGSLIMSEAIFPTSLDLTVQAGARSRAEEAPLELVVWPEDSTGWDVTSDPGRAGALTDVAEQAGAPLLVGTQSPAPGDRRYNEALLWTGEGDVAARYAKRHPVPFGEYIPARPLFRQLSDKVDLVPIDMAAGSQVGVLPVGEHRVGVLICFEIAYENLVQDVVADGAHVIVVPTNTALFGDSDEAAQQLGEARVLSAISGRSIVQVATAGESAIVTPDGRDLSRVGHWDQGVVVADVPLHTGITPAVAAGPWIAVGAAALGLAGWLLALTSPRPAPRSTRGPQPRSRS